MAKRLLDKYGKQVGEVETSPNGDQKINNKYGQLRGEYKQSNDTTYDQYGKTVGEGNQLSSLLDD